MEWGVKGECPKHVSKNSNSLDTLAILNQLKTKPFTDFGSTMFEEPKQRCVKGLSETSLDHLYLEITQYHKKSTGYACGAEKSFTRTLVKKNKSLL